MNSHLSICRSIPKKFLDTLTKRKITINEEDIFSSYECKDNHYITLILYCSDNGLQFSVEDVSLSIEPYNVVRIKLIALFPSSVVKIQTISKYIMKHVDNAFWYTAIYIQLTKYHAQNLPIDHRTTVHYQCYSVYFRIK